MKITNKLARLFSLTLALILLATATSCGGSTKKADSNSKSSKTSKLNSSSSKPAEVSGLKKNKEHYRRNEYLRSKV